MTILAKENRETAVLEARRRRYAAGKRRRQRTAGQSLGKIMLAALWLTAAGNTAAFSAAEAAFPAAAAGNAWGGAAAAEAVRQPNEDAAPTEGAVRIYDEKDLHEADGKLADINNIPVTGEVRAYYPGGRILEKSYYTDGVKNGSARLFFENGMLLSEATYADGKEEGVAKIYYASGDLLAAVTFEKGKAVAGNLILLIWLHFRTTDACLARLSRCRERVPEWALRRENFAAGEQAERRAFL